MSGADDTPHDDGRGDGGPDDGGALDLLLTDAALGPLRRLNPGRSGARLVRDLALTNSLTRAGATTMLGSPVDLGSVQVDSYVVAGIADHICPWQSSYSTTQLLGGTTRFVLSTAGHIASLVNPSTNARATYRTSQTNPVDR